MAYNSYLVQDGKNILFDTVDRRKEEEWKENVLNALNGEELDYLVIQHLEPDHSSGIDWVLQKFPKAKLIASAKQYQCFLILLIRRPKDGLLQLRIKKLSNLETWILPLSLHQWCIGQKLS